MITIDEIREAAFSLKRNKVGGCDGWSLEFYLHFFDEIKDSLWVMYKEVLDKKVLGCSTRSGIISLLPKKGKDSCFLKNLHPLTLLTIEYKILAKVLVTRLKAVLPDLISVDQTGFMEGCYIQSNIRKTIDIVSHIYQSGKRAVIISIDFKKCFDRIEHRSIYEAMEYFGFGNNFIGWSSIFFNQFRICAQNAGFTSDFFAKGRGVNQGCPISPFYHNLCTETMSHLIKNNKKIKGIKLNDGMKGETKMIISQFADDAALFLHFSEECINAVIDTLMYVESCTGLKVSYDKTCVYRVGSLKHSNVTIYTRKPLHWSDGDIELLGVSIKNAPYQDCTGYNATIVKMNNVMNLWQNRSLTVVGKILLINSLMFSLFVYKMTMLPPISQEQINKINTIIKNFLWGKRKSKIPTEVLCNGKNKGGLKLSDFQKRQQVLYISWIPKLQKDDTFNYTYDWIELRLREKIWECNIAYKDVKRYS